MEGETEKGERGTAKRGETQSPRPWAVEEGKLCTSSFPTVL